MEERDLAEFDFEMVLSSRDNKVAPLNRVEVDPVSADK